MELAGLEPGDLLGAIRRIVPCWRLIGFFELVKGYWASRFSQLVAAPPGAIRSPRFSQFGSTVGSAELPA